MKQLISTPPFSSKDPRTQALRMRVVDERHQLAEIPGETTPAPSAENASDAEVEAVDYKALDVAALKALAEKRSLEVTGTGKDGNVLKKDLVAALEEADEAAENDDDGDDDNN